ncbi:hypothetical protein [Cyanobium sp. Morenito 9A2]|uniref:hypothetical protein n=1 Tax=Cyanobium sp. Morenito 9A2 TaxID=2823718 RepID=UPI0020CDB509|nr:hypothetical protein [Cyanobium sp. Morenito 9A2]MCP9850873.1 hypothetical protein [Cyanobium sp. Morenito 9A2]
MTARPPHRRAPVWVHAPWIIALLLVLQALWLLTIAAFNWQTSGWVLLGSAAICFSIGCVCKISWELAQRR